ncbi:MAG TPA: hypothetical protein EYP35_02025 [Desulfobacterales bacterium]|nr:hypothetical protein [Desulfobacterales bacterium]HIP38162.1 hypothetical protein [Desulfocapsa sulfexigens]
MAKHSHGLGLSPPSRFFLSLLIIPLIINRLEGDFFLHLHEHKKLEDQHPVIFILLRILRYSFGALLLTAGILMLFLPGQGLLTIILGISLLDFPGKQKAIDGLLHLHPIQKGLNWIREKEDKPPFLFPDNDD